MTFILETSFKDDTDGDVIVKLRHMATLFDSHDAYKTDLPPWIPGGRQFREYADRLEQLVNLPASDKTRDDEKIAVREKSVKTVNLAVQYVTMYSEHLNDPTLLENLGLQVKHRNYSRDPRLPGKVERFLVKDSEDTGAIEVQVNNGFDKKGSLELQIAEGDPANEASWRTIDHYFTCRIKVKGLEPVKRYYLRARFKTAAGNGPWSDVANVVVS